MASQKPLRILYQAKNNTTGLTDVKAQVYLNGVAKAVGGSAIVLSEVDSVNSPGLYELLILAATLTTWGVAAGSYNCIEGYIDSVSHSAKAPFREELTVANTDDIDSKLGSPAGASVSADIAAIKSELGTPAGASVSADIAAVKADTAAIKVDVESAASSLPNILAAVQAIQNNAGFAIPVPAQVIIPPSGSNTYKIPLTIYNEKNQLVDPDSSSIIVGLVNYAGVDRGSYLTGSSGSPATVAATRDSLGQYHVDVVIPSSAPQEELIFTFSYAIGGAATARKAVTVAVTDVNADGFALQTTLLATQTTVNSIQSEVTDGSSGLAAIKSAVDALQSDVTSNVEGAGFDNSTDSLVQISSFLRANLYQGGRAV